ncbi:hypothetical protein [Hydrogenophaga sp. 5NK40-0174]|uniref:hypothetical protein n=1 Tax=Hydrogenophaga sp. 5NK40-0174 TaxID=3127649 RepID=UPI003341C6AA
MKKMKNEKNNASNKDNQESSALWRIFSFGTRRLVFASLPGAPFNLVCFGLAWFDLRRAAES